MAYRVAELTDGAMEELKSYRIEAPGSGGLVLEELEARLEDGQCWKLENVWFKADVPTRRPGQEAIAGTLPANIVNIFERTYQDKIILSAGGTLYEYSNGGYTSLLSNIGTGKGKFFEFNGRLYYINGTKYIVYDGTTCAEVVPYIPNVIINRSPAAGGGDLDENYNRIGAGFKNTFSAFDGDYEVTSLTIYVGVTSSGGIAITLNGEDYGWSFAADTSAALVAQYIRDNPPTGYACAGAGYTVTFTATVKGAAAEPTIAEMEGGISATIAQENAGANGQASYKLTDTGLDATAVTAVVDGVTLSENTGFTVDRTNGIVTFGAVPPAGTNNVVITAYKTHSNYVSNFLACTCAESFGGVNETRVFFGGNGTSTYFWSGVLDPSYIPENNYNVLGDNTKDVVGFGEQYDYLVIFKENEVWALSYSYDVTNGAVFSVKPVNRRIGCDAPDSIQLINNNLVWFYTKIGVCILLSTDLSNERNIEIISRNINGNARRPGLLAETGLKDAVSVDYEGCYILAANNHAYLWDYRRTPYSQLADTYKAQKRLCWFYWTNIAPNGFCLVGDDLYFAKGTGLCRFYDRYIDYGTAFLSVIRVPLRDFGVISRKKTIVYVYLTARGDANNLFYVKYITENAPAGRVETRSIEAISFDVEHLDLDHFTLDVVNFQKSIRLKPNQKNVYLFGLEFYCAEEDMEMNICEIEMQIRIGKRIK